MNPIIYACSSREFKRAFIRILRCQWRRRARSFLDSDTVVTGSSTEMNKIGRVSFRNFSRRTARQELGEAGTRLLMTSVNGTKSHTKGHGKCHKGHFDGRFDAESPIASLRFLHESRHHKMESDDDSSHQGSDEELSQPDDPLMGGRVPQEPGKRPAPMAHLHTAKTIKSDRRWQNIPDIVVDDVSHFDGRRRSNGQTESHGRKRSFTPVTNFSNKEERIMWL